MKIYLYLKHFPPFGDKIIGGTSRSTHGFASGLAACSADVTILCEGDENSSFQTKAGYKIECFATRQQKPSWQIAPTLKQYIRDRINRKSIVVINGLFNPSVYGISRILKKYGIPYIMSPRSIYHPAIFQKKPQVKWPYWYLFEKRLLQEAQALQLQDIRQAEWLCKLGVKTPVIEVPNGFEPRNLQPESSLGWRTHGLVKLFFFGRIDAYQKSLDLLIEAFALTPELADAQLILQGADAGDKKQLQARAEELKISEKVFFLAPDYDSTPSSIIAKYDIFCLPSRIEGFANSALEAMLAGRVLLVSEIDGIAPHVIDSGCGVVVKPDISAIKAGLTKLLHHRSQWQEMGVRGRDYVLKHLNWNNIAAKTLDTYKELIS